MKESGHGSNNDEASAHVRAKERSLSQALCRGAAKRRSKGRLLRGGGGDFTVKGPPSSPSGQDALAVGPNLRHEASSVSPTAQAA